jgi:hypothetical protein
MSTAAVRRPFGVSLLSILIIIGGVFDVLGGILLLFERNDRESQVDFDMTSSQITWWAIGAIIIGVVAILVAVALRNGSQFARYLIAVIAAIRLISLIFALIRFDSIHWYHALVPLLVYGLVTYYLFFDKDAKGFFDRTSAQY